MTLFDNSRIFGLMQQYNPWWQTGAVGETLPTVRRQAYADLLHTVADSEYRRFAVLSGARRVGKTTVMKQVIAELLGRGVPPTNILYLSFDNPIVKLCGMEQVLATYDEMIPHTGLYYFFFDEIQYADNWSLWVKTLYDTRADLRLAATGSASPAIEKGASDSGVGRWRTFRMPTLTFREYCAIAGVSVHGLDGLSLEKLLAMQETEFKKAMLMLSGLTPHWNRYLMLGGFPELVHGTRMDEAQRILREDVVDKVLKRDVPALFDVRNSSQLEKIFLYLCLNTSGIINYSGISGVMEGVSKPTVVRYIDYLRDANLLYLSPSLGGGAKGKLGGQPKAYIADAALRNACLMINNPTANETDLGIMVETAVYKHFFTAYGTSAHVGYLRTTGKDKEVDVVVELPSLERILCEVKYRHGSPVGAQDAIMALSSAPHTKAAIIATKDAQDFSITTTQEGAKVFRIPAPALCYILGVNS